jgi:hypothetical protein
MRMRISLFEGWAHRVLGSWFPNGFQMVSNIRTFVVSSRDLPRLNFEQA